MRKTLLLIVMTTAPGWSFCQQDAHAGTLEIVRSIDFPYDFANAIVPANAIGVGIAWDGQSLWGTFSLFVGGVSSQETVELDPSDGSLIRRFAPYAGQNSLMTGSAWGGNGLWNTSFAAIQWNQEPGSPPDDTWVDSVVKWGIDDWQPPAGYPAQTVSFPAPASPDAVLRGVAWDGSYLWLSDSKHRQITQVDPADGSVIRSFPSPGTDPRGLTWDGSSLWIVDAADNVIHQVDTFGNLLDTWSAPGTGRWPYDIAFDGQYLWLLENESDSIYQLAIPEPTSVGLLISATLALLFLAWQRCKRGS